MKNILFLVLACSISSFGQTYVPFPTQNTEWNSAFYATYENFPGVKDSCLLNYSLGGDTILDSIKYTRLILNHNNTVGFLREENKRIYYMGAGYTNTGASYSPGQLQKLKNCSPSFLKTTFQEYLLYDFNAKAGDNISWGYEGNIIDWIDSVKINGSYRKQYHMKWSNDIVIEGIGSVVKGLLNSVSPLPNCGGSKWWEQICFSQNGQTLYLNPAYVSCNSTQKWSEKKYFAKGDSWTEYTTLTYISQPPVSYITSKRQYFLGTDTLISGVLYHNIIENTPNDIQHPTNLVGFLREENGKVFVNLQNSGEFLLYDFTLKVGDTIHSNLPDNSFSEPHFVTKIDTIQLSTGEKRKRFYSDNISYIEGIGSSAGLFGMHWNFCTCDPYYTSTLVCFKSEIAELYKDNSWLCLDGTCCDILMGTNFLTSIKSNVVISPNPVSDWLTVKSDIEATDYTFELLDIHGKIILQKQLKAFQNSLNISEFSNGLYLYRLLDNGKILKSGKIVKI
jgi:hypothetical protein